MKLIQKPACQAIQISLEARAYARVEMEIMGEKANSVRVSFRRLGPFRTPGDSWESHRLGFFFGL